MEYLKFDCGCSFEKNGKAIRLDIESIPLTCKRTWDLISKGLTKGVFQLESPLGRQWTKKLKPEHIEHLSALGSILRPGCLRSLDKNGVSTTEHYCLRKNNQEPVSYFHKALEPILKNSYGMMIFQEQAMAIAKELAGFNLQEADELRKAVGKKLPEEMAKVEHKFITKAKETNILTEEEAQQIFAWIKEGQRYSFNACVTGDTIIVRMHKGRFPLTLTVKEMFNIRNDISYAKSSNHLSLYKKWKFKGNYGSALSLCEDKRVKPNIIKDIQYAGLQDIYRVQLNSGHIDVTINHKFPTPDGIKTVEQLIKHPVRLYVCGSYEQTDWGKYRFSNWALEDIHNRKVTHDGRAGFMSGSNNPGYVNGAYTEFCKNVQELPQYCQLCGAVGCRLEVHHVDGDRTHNNINNLVRLCSSCHKREEYKAGRIKIGEKGYPVKLEFIESIKKIRQDDVYDIVMKAPNHNFVANNGVITCNSHSVSYAINGYWSAYCKAHFPIQFFTSWLKNAHYKQKPKKEICELINEARLLDIKVLPPDLTNLQAKFHTDGKVITFGITDIKGLGDAIFSKVLKVITEEEGKAGSQIQKWTWLQLLGRLIPRVGETVLANLISVGALRKFISNRTQALHELTHLYKLSKGEKTFLTNNVDKFTSTIDILNNIMKPKKEGGACQGESRRQIVHSIIDMLKNPGKNLEDSPNWIAGTEEILLGIAITCSRIDSCDVSAINTTCRQFVNNEIKDRGSLILGVEIQNVAETKTKKGKNPGRKMARVTISDGSAAIDAVCFPEAYKEFHNLLTNRNTVIIEGEKDRKQGGFIIHRVYQAELLEVT